MTLFDRTISGAPKEPQFGGCQDFAPYPFTGDPAANWCPACLAASPPGRPHHEPGRWVDGYDQAHCVRCDPPAALGQVRRVELFGHRDWLWYMTGDTTDPGPLGWWDVTALIEQADVWPRVWPHLESKRADQTNNQTQDSEGF